MAEGGLDVTVLFSPAPREMLEWQLRLPAGSTVADAIAASPLRSQFPAFDIDAAGVGVWGRKASAQHLLREGDRIEVYRALKVDPKVARRERFRRQGARAAGLFARKKPRP
jgi:putative ubiquitin-RnfH superfamily antitoxin RatB of RatAB toxin-antitoxin module